jgi:hypothetical protein
MTVDDDDMLLAAVAVLEAYGFRYKRLKSVVKDLEECRVSRV